MPKPPKYNYKKLKDNSQFLCVKGDFVYVNKKDIDNNPLPSTLKSYYSKSNTNVPIEILNTGNIDVIERYLAQHAGELNQTELEHLNERIDVMNYFNDLERYYQNNKRKSVGKMQRNRRGQKVLPDIVLDRNQDTGNGCWSCAFSMLLKGRGVDVDQKLIRRYRPEFQQGNEPISPEQTDTINSNMVSEIYQYSSLVDKICPNTKMCKMDKSTHGATEAQIRTEVFKCLREKNAPVAFCNGFHWTTIVGVNDAGDKFYVVDSLNPTPGAISEVSVNSYLLNPSAEFVWMEDIVLEKNGKSKQLPDSTFTVDPQSGSVIPKIQGQIEEGANDMSIRGNHIIDGSTSIESYVPRMIRDYSKPYADQKLQSDHYLHDNGVILYDEPKPIKYTPVSSNSYNAVKTKLENQVERNVFSDRKAYLRDNCGFSQDEIDRMTVEEANANYEQMRIGTDNVRQQESINDINDIDENIFSFQDKEYDNPTTSDYMTDAQYEEYLKSLNASDPKPQAQNTQTKEVKQPAKDDENDILRDIEEQRYQILLDKMSAAEKINSPGKKELMTDIALSEYSLGVMTMAYMKAPNEKKELYKDAIVDEMGKYLTKITINKKLDSIDLEQDANIIELLTSEEQLKEYEKVITSSKAVENITDKMLKNPEDILFMNSDDVFKDFLSEQSAAAKQKNAPEDTKHKEENIKESYAIIK